jgi:hypothetical protein
MSATDGLMRGMKVIDTVTPPSVPVAPPPCPGSLFLSSPDEPQGEIRDDREF